MFFSYSDNLFKFNWIQLLWGYCIQKKLGAVETKNITDGIPIITGKPEDDWTWIILNKFRQSLW